MTESRRDPPDAGHQPATTAPTRTWRGMLLFAARLAGGTVAAGCFVAGLWFAFTTPAEGFILMGLGIVLGVVFGRVPAGVRKSG